ncbi:MAG: metallophosphoesterase [Hyphomicrobiales bacterium]|nr:metallophosphoesterase [Hyphomicrobiales bacterium]
MMSYLLAHLSDPHLAPLPSWRIPELIGKRITGLVNWHRKRSAMHRPEVLARIVADLKRQSADHIAITGDLVNLALPDEYPAARAWLGSLGSPRDVTLVPGNHDAYVRPGMTASQTYWSEFMRADEAAPGAPAFPFLRRRGPLALIGVSTSVPSLPLLAIGRVGDEQLRRLAPLLDQCGREGLFRVLMIHHPPTSRRSHFLKRLTDGARLCAVLARHGAELVIHGHNHRHQTVWIDGPNGRIPSVGVPSASEALPGEHDPAGYNLYRVAGERGVWTCDMISRGLSEDRVVELRRVELMRDRGP